MKEKYKYQISQGIEQLMKDRLYVHPKDYDYNSDIPQTTYHIASDADIALAESLGQTPIIMVSTPNAKLLELIMQRISLVLKIEKIVEEAGWEFEEPYSFPLWPKAYKTMLPPMTKEEIKQLGDRNA